MAARRSVPDLAERLYAETVKSMHEDRLLDAAIQFSGAKPLMVHMRRLLPEGRRAVGQWPVAPPKAEVDERKRRRLLFMDTLYGRVGDDTLQRADVEDVEARLGWSRGEAEPIVTFLANRGLVDWMMGNQVSITQRGSTRLNRPAMKRTDP